MVRSIYCSTCGHAPLAHIEDGLGGAVCKICVFLAAQKETLSEREKYPVCVTKFIFKVPKRDREQAMHADKESWPTHTPCVQCGGEWCQHTGYLCPDGNSTFLPLLESMNA